MTERDTLKPWHWQFSSYGPPTWLSSEDGGPVLEIDDGDLGTLWVKESALPLIEAAPNLLAVLEHAVDFGYLDDAPPHVLRRAKQAVAKATRVRKRLIETAAQALTWQKVIEVEIRVDEYQADSGEPDDRVRIHALFRVDRYEWARAGDRILTREFGAEDVGHSYLSLGGPEAAKFRPPMIGHIDGKTRQWFPYDDELWTALKTMGADWKQAADEMDYRAGNLLTLAWERAKEAQGGKESGNPDPAAGSG